MSKIHFVSLAAGIVLATAFTFSCSSDDGGSESSSSGNGSNQSSSSATGQSSSLSSSGVDLSSSSSEIPSSSSSDEPSSSSVAIEQSSSSNPSSSSVSGPSSSSVASAVCGPSTETQNSVTYGGKEYKIVTIGEQVWFAENLNCEVEGSVCYDNDPANCAKYGRLYDWNAAMKACPSGWHLPTDGEWTTLTDYAGGASKAGAKLRTTSGWEIANYAPVDATDDYEFSALPGGKYSGAFSGAGAYGLWLSATESNASNAWIREMGLDWGAEVFRTNGEKNVSYSVRCVQGDGGSVNPSSSSVTASSSSNSGPICGSVEYDPETEYCSNGTKRSYVFVDYEDQTYKTVVIGTQTWMAENLNYETEGSKCYDDLPSNCDTYGRLYDWETAMTVCPSGWRLPSDTDWNRLIETVGGETGAFSKLAAKNDDWVFYVNVPSGSMKLYAGDDTYGFSALAGSIYGSSKSLSPNDAKGYWWSSKSRYDQRYNDEALYLLIELRSASDRTVRSYYTSKPNLLSVRCVK